MKKPTFSRAVYTALILLLSLTAVAQTLKPFAIRKNVELKGKMLVIGNNILGKDNNPLNDNSVNENISMQNIDIDGDPTTFNSSSADLKVPAQKDGSPTTCYRISYAALYWGAMLQSGSRTDINKIKLKVPGGTTYNNVTGTVIYDAISSPIVPDNNTPYACYADVTSLLSNLSSLTGTYTVADMVTSTGLNGSTGLSAGWTLFVIYEDPNLNMKSFTTFDGFAALYDGRTVTVPVTGFRTPPSGPVDLQFAYAALDGDKPGNKSKLEFGGKEIATPLRGPANNFFNSTIENSWGVSDPRNPSGTNTLGYDTGMLEVKGANPEYIKNNQTSTDFTLQVARGQADPVFTFLGAYAVDIIAPDIKLTKIVKNSTGTDIGGANVTLGDYLYYEINYQNLGNDNVTGMTIKDVLPKNIIFNYPADLDLTNAGGITVQSYDPATRTIIFNVPDASVQVGDPVFTIRIKAQIVPDCNMLTDACSNEIKNQATATYKGVINTNTFNTDSFSSTGCNFGVATPTNFLVNIDNCKFTQKVVLCNNSVLLTGPNGYDSYVWSKTLGGSSIGTGQTYTATQTGVYYVHASSLATCLPIDQEVTVVPFGNTVTNPVIPYAQSPYAGSVTTCTINGKSLPNLFLCGANDYRDIKTGIVDVTSIIWEKLNENGTCPAATSTTVCANESASCSWSQVGTGPDYKANTAGQFRLTINYTGGCFSVFYFNVFQNLLNPTVVSKDITCNTKGQITVNGIPASGYEFSLDNGGTGTYQASNIFNNVSAGLHNVYIRQVGVTNACLFKVLNVQILNRIYQVNVNVTQPLCNGGKGSVTLQANNVLPQYYYSISQGATLVNSAGPLNANDYTFSNLNPGAYTVRVWTDDGCDYSQNITIINPAQLTATAALTKPLTCTDGEITIYPVGGTAPYIYYINSTTTSQNTPTVVVTNPLPAGGIYNITVEDSNNCTATTSVTAAATPAPVYTISTTNVLCYGDATGVIQFNVSSNAGGYTLSYSIDDGATYSNNHLFSGLVAGTPYTPKLRYTLDGVNYCYDTKPAVTLTGPNAALTASAGVSELAGCGDVANGIPKSNGKVRITNPQGGVPPYQYSFDNQASWGTKNEAYVAPGTYTLYIKDANGCIFPMSGITLDPEPVAPTINVANAVFNCDGTANTTVTITNPGNANYQYDYLLDNNPNTNVPSNVFVNVPSGSHTVSVTYKLVSVSTYSNLLNEDFGSGAPTTTPGIASAYCFNDQHVNSPYACGTRSVEDNQYSVANDFWRSDDTSSKPAWYHYKDHTTNGTDAKGRFLLVNIGSAAGPYGVLYSKPIADVIPNQPIIVDVYLANLLRSYMTNADCDFKIELVDSAGNVIDSKFTGIIPKNEKWNLKSLSLNPQNNTNLTFKIRSGSILYNGNDAVIDDIKVYQLPKSCITQVDFPFEVPTGKAFDASVTGFKNVSCAGANDGEITIAAQNFDPTKGFQYSINNGTTWDTQMNSPYTITGLSPNNYTVLIRYDASSTGSCVKTVSQAITSPTALTVSALRTQDVTCLTGATITAIANGGTQAYQYELRKSDGVTIVTAFSTNAVFTNVSAGSYKVFAKDANGCTTSVGADVNVDAPPTLSAAIDPASDLCFDTVNQASLIVNVTGGTSPFTYSLDGAAAQNSNTFTNVGVGTHNILVTDSKNCTATISNINIATQLQLTANLTQDLTCLVNASINATVTGGNGAPYTYTVSRNGGAATAVASFPYTATIDGNYVFIVTDSKGCSATSNTVVVSPKTTPTLTTAKTDITCNNANDGTITVTASNGFTTVYTYAIKLSSAATYTTQASNQFTGLAAGTYNIKVIDSKGCESAVSNVTIANPAVITGNISATDLQCSPSGTVPAVVTVTASGGTGSYKYSFNGTSSFTTTNTFSTTSSGAVTAYIQDANGCQIGPLSVTVTTLAPITDITIVDNGYDCSTTPPGGQVTLTAVKAGAANPISYQIISGPAGFNATANSTGIFQGLAGGSYVFQATDTKTNCSFTKPYTVSGTPAIAAGGSVVTPIKCFGGTGDIQFTVSGVSASGYDYVIKDAGNVTVASNTNQTASTVSLNNVATGSYTITVTDRKTKCTATYTVTLTQPTAALVIVSATATNINCNNDNSQITVSVSGGTPNYSYAFAKNPSVAPTSTYGSSAVLTVDTNSGADMKWDVYVQDVNGCSAKTTVTVVSDPMPAITSVVVNNQCTATGSNFTITATGTGGIAPLTYGIGGATGAFQSSSTFTVAPGTYTIWVKDANGCAVPAASSVTVSPQLTASSAVTKTLDCSGSPDAVITTTITGGKAPYTYTVQKGSGAVSASSAAAASFTYNVSNANADTYTFVITDANGCSFTTTATVNAITNPTVSETHVNPLCKGGANGSVQLAGAGGSGGYTYSKDNVTFGASGLFTGLLAGTYTFYVKDSKGCQGTVTATLTDPSIVGVSAVVTTPFSCSVTNTKNAAVITVTGSGGSGTYTYSFNNGASFSPANTLTVNDNGTTQSFDIIVKDGNGCSSTVQRVDLMPLNPPTDLGFSNAAVTCTAPTTTVTLTTTNGVGSLQYETIAPSLVIIPKQSSNIFAGLASGNYTFKVTDANNCYYTESYSIAPVTPIAIAGNVNTNVDCKGNSTGKATFIVSGNATVGAYTFVLTAGTLGTGTLTQSGNTLNLTNVVAGTYTVRVTDSATGCFSDASVTITEPTNSLSITSATATKVFCSKYISQITVGAVGGTLNYSYAALPAGSTAIPTYGSSNVINVDTSNGTILSWDVYVKDASGCSTVTTTPVNVVNDPSPSVTVAVTNQCTASGNSFVITATGTGLAPLTYGIGGPTGAFQSGNTFTVVPGSYTVWVKDANGCTASAVSPTVVSPQLTLTAVLNKGITCPPAPTDAQITLSATGGSGSFTYESKEALGGYTSMGSNVFNTGVAGSYTFRVTDTVTGCLAVTTTPIVTTTPVNPDITGVSQTRLISCNGDADAAISIAIDNTKGQAPFVFNVLNTTTGTNYGTKTTGLAAGDYVITITDAKGCTDTGTISITEPTAITVHSHSLPITCGASGLSKGSIIVDDASGGTKPYSYYVTGVNGYNNSATNVPGTAPVTFSVVDFGIYQINVIDANGCSKLTQNITVASPPDDLDISVVPASPNCTGLGSATVAIGNSPTSPTGNGPFYFRLYDGTVPNYPAPAGTWLPEDFLGSKKTTFTNLIPGVTYTFVVYDADAAHGGTGTGCYYYETSDIPIPTKSKITVDPLVTKNVTCKGTPDGNVTFTMNHTYGVVTPVKYQIYDSQTVTPVGGSVNTIIPASGSLEIKNFGSLPFGNYFVLVTEDTGATNAGCSIASAPFDITESTIDLTVTASVIKNANCNNDGIIEVQGHDGTPSYTYQVTTSSTFPLANDLNWVSNNTFTKPGSLAPGTLYYVYVKDFYGCIKQNSISLVQDAPPAISAPTPICYDGSTAFTIDLSLVSSASIAPATYSVNGSAFQTSPSFTFNAARTYNLVIKDGNGCTANVDYVVNPQVILNAQLTQDLTCTSNASITLTPTGGTGTYNAFEVSTDGGTSWGAVGANPFITNTDGSYIFRVSDNQVPSCPATSNTINVTAKTTPTATKAQTNVSCKGGGDGTITITPANGIVPYTYTLTGAGANTTGDVTGIYTGLIAGTYTFVVTDAKNCTYTDTVTITEPTPVGGSISVTTGLSCGSGNATQPATVTVNGTGGTSPYQYSFDGVNYSSTNTFSTNLAGSVTAWIKDANGCLIAAPVSTTVTPLDPPTDLTFNATPIFCSPVARQTSTVDVKANKGVGALSFKIIATNSGTAPALWGPISTPGFATPATFTGLLPGDYTFEVTDSNSCTYQELLTIKPVNNITVSGQLISDVTCNPGSNGEVLFTIANFTGNYTYSLNGGGVSAPQNNPTISVSGLSSSGAQTIDITDVVTGCTATASVNVSISAPLALVANPFINANCNMGAKVSVTASGGVAPYSYSYVVSGAPAGTYSPSASAILDPAISTSWDVYVKDSNGCVITSPLPITINKDASPVIAMPASQCFVGSPLTINLLIGQNVPVGPATYTINGSNQTSPIYTITAPGTYQLSIVDGNGCISNTVNYVVNPQLILDAKLTQDLTCISNASITLTPTGGTGTYNAFEVSTDGGTSWAVVATNPFTATVDGSYVFRVSDNQVPSCPAISSAVTVTPKTTPTATFTQTNVSCNGGADGTITVTPANGIAPYQYSKDGELTYQSSNVFTGLTDAGVYNIVVKDAKGCTSVAIPVDITQPLVVTASSAVTPFGCNTSNTPQDAIVTITAGGGTPGYTYSFDGGATFQASPSFTVNKAQTINYVVHDANGCSASGSATVLPYTPPTDMNLTATPIYCSTPGTVATVTVNSVTGGVAPYTYEIISPASAVTPPSAPSAPPFSFTNLAPNTYVIKVTDANGCSTTKSIEVKEASKISVTPQLVNNVYCKGGATGTVNFLVANYITAGNYAFNLTPAAGTFTQTGDVISYTGLPAGSYTFTVTDGVSGCQASVVNFAVSEPLVALSSSSVATNINCNNDNATITVTANGGTAPYRYAVAKAGNPMPAAASFITNNQLVVDTNNGADMNWVVYVKDANGCDTNNPQAILTDANPTIASAVATQCPSATGTYTITVTASGFNSALQYSVDGVSFQTSNIITVNKPGTYNVTVKDANGCPSASTSVTIVQPLSLTPKVTTMPSCANNDGVITVSATGGSGNYVYNIDGGAFGAAAIFNNVASGSHSMGVRDTTTLCEVYVSIILTPATPITGFALSKTDVTCNGGNDGTITATMDTPALGVNDNPVYMYSLNGGTPQASNVFAGLTAGNYTVTVTSGRGCTATASIPVNEPGIITVPSPTVVQFGCTSGNAMNFATLTVSGVTGGSGTYSTYEFFKNGVSVQRGASNVYTETNLAGGSYSVTVYDDKGCQGSTSTPIIITPFTPMDKINVVVNQAINCTNPESITVTAVDASGVAITGVQYTVADKNATTGVSGGVFSQTNTTGVFTGLPVGNYVITATNLATGCSIKDVHYVAEPNTFDLTVDNIVDVTCYGGANGSANVTIVDKTLPDQAGSFSYTLVAPNGTSTTGNSPTAGPFVLNNLVAGTYTITATLTNNPFCSVSKLFTINQPTAALKISETHMPITCMGNDGTISATAIGGWSGTYEFELTGPVNVAYSTQSNFANLSAGLYTIKVRDSKGCVDQVQVNLVNPTPIAASIIVDKPLLACFGDTNATITVKQPVTGGSGNYKYTLEATYPNGVVTLSGPQASNVFANLGAGSYRVSVTDTWTCAVWTNTIVINQPTVVTANLVKTTAQTCLNPATLTLSAAGGTGPYTYSTDPNFGTVLGSFASSVTFAVPFANAPVKYVYYVKDANGCSNAVSNDIDVAPLEPLDFAFENNNPYINCLGDNDGEITAAAKGGSGNYVYTLLNGSGAALPTTPTQLTPGHFSQLTAGNYILRVTSGDCTLSKPITITQPNTALTFTPVVTNVTCNGYGNGKLELTAQGGTGVIKFAISPDLDKFLDSGTFLNLAVGHYQAIIQDVNGCNHIYDFDITEPAPINANVDPLTIKQELCAGEKTGEFAITIAGGTAPYTTSIDNDTFVANRVLFTGLSGGKHTVIVKDANSCELSFDVLLNPAVTLNPEATVSNDCVNNAAANKVTVHIDESNIPADVTYSLDNSGVWQSSNVFTNLTPGDHFIMVKHKNGCIDATDVFPIAKVDPLTISLSLGGLNEIVATVTGGSGVYQFTVNGEAIGSNNKYIYFRSGDYTVTVTDSYGCSVSATKYFEFIDITIPPIFTPNGDGNNDNWKPTNTENYPDIKFIVYDRYGRQVGVFGAGQSWDGKYNGQELPTGDYWYILKLRHAQDDREFVGHFTLYR